MAFDAASFTAIESTPVAKKKFDAESFVPIEDKRFEERVFVENTGEVVKLPTGGLNRLIAISREAFKKGDATTEISQLQFQEFISGQNPKIKSRIEELNKKANRTIKTKGLEEILRASSEQIPNIREMFERGLLRGLQTGLATGIGAAALAPPTAPLATAAGFTAGFTLGSVESAFVLETGAAFGEIKQFKDKDGKLIDQNIARLGAFMAGSVSAGLEFASFSMLVKVFPGGQNILRKMGGKAGKALKLPTTRKALKDFLLNLSKVVSAETVTEGLQEVSAISGGEFAKFVDDKEFDKITARNAIERVVDASKEGFKASLGLGGAASTTRLVSDVTRAKRINKALKQIEADKKTLTEKDIEGVERKKSVTDEEGNRVEIDAVEGVDSVDAKIKKPPVEQRKTKLGSFVDTQLQKEIDKSKKKKDALDVAEGELRELEGIRDSEKESTVFLNDLRSEVTKEIRGTKIKSSGLTSEEALIPKTLLSGEGATLDDIAGRENISEALGILGYDPDATGLRQFISDEIGQQEVGTRRILRSEKQGKSTLVTNAIKEKKAEIKELKPGLIAKRETTILNDKIENIKRGFKKGVVETAKVIGERIRAVNDVIKILNKNDKGKFNRTIVQVTQGDISNQARFDNLIKTIEARVDRLVEEAEIRKIRASIEARLKIARPKISGKKIKSKFGSTIQSILDQLREANKLTKSLANATLLKRLDKDMVGTPADAIINRFLELKRDGANVSLKGAQLLDAQIEAMMDAGESVRAQELLAKQLKLDALIEEGSEILDSQRNIKVEQKTGFSAFLDGVPKSMRSFIRLLVSNWKNDLDIIFPEAFAKNFEVTNEIDAEKLIRIKWTRRLLKDAKEAFNMKDERDIAKKFDADGKIHLLGNFINVNGDAKVLKVSVSQVRALYMQSLDSTLTETLTSKKGNAYTFEMLNAMFSLLDDKDFRFVDRQLKSYQEFYVEINDVYSRVFGINLPKNLFYSPIRREVDSGDLQVDEFLRDQNYRGEISSRSLKLRATGAIESIMLRSDIATFNRHVSEMARFIALREKVQEINAFFGDKNIKAKIITIYGKSAFNVLNDQKDSLITGGIKSANIFEQVANELNKNYALSQLQGKAKIGITQLTSLFSYAETIPVTDFVEGVTDFIFNHKEAVKILGNTGLLQDRGFDPEVDIQSIGKVFDSQFLNTVRRKKMAVHDFLLIATRMGDRAAIYMGGWAVYKSVLKRTGSKKAAITEFLRQTGDTQQSSDPDMTSLLQKGNPLAKGLAMFKSAPMAQFRGEARAIRKFFFKKETTPQQFVKSMIIYHFILPQLYQLLSNAIFFGEFDEEDQIRAAVLGSMNGIPIIGEAVEGAFRVAQGKRAFQGDSLKWARAVTDLLKTSGIAISELIQGDFEDFTEAVVKGLNPAGVLVGAPTSQTENINKGIKDVNNGRVPRGVARFFGWPESVVREIK